jgi:hypothetical protein
VGGLNVTGSTVVTAFKNCAGNIIFDFTF